MMTLIQLHFLGSELKEKTESIAVQTNPMRTRLAHAYPLFTNLSMESSTPSIGSDLFNSFVTANAAAEPVAS